MRQDACVSGGRKREGDTSPTVASVSRHEDEPVGPHERLVYACVTSSDPLAASHTRSGLLQLEPGQRIGCAKAIEKRIAARVRGHAQRDALLRADSRARPRTSASRQPARLQSDRLARRWSARARGELDICRRDHGSRH